MRLVCGSVLASFLCALPLPLGNAGGASLAQSVRPSSMPQRSLVVEAVFQCGMFDGKFSCKAAPGGAPQGKNATQGVPAATPEAPPEGVTGEATNPAAIPYGAATPAQGAEETPKAGEHSCPPGYKVLAVPGKFGYCEPPGAGTAEAAPSACQHGMVSTAGACRCPKSSELLGGNCVHYTATMCQSELPVNVNPEPCQDLEAKLSCKMRQDGLKDCCCLTYDKL
jgi:hypothetical protein